MTYPITHGMMKPGFIILFAFLLSFYQAIAQTELLPKMEEAVTAIESGSFGEVHSLLIIKDHKTIFEQYFNDWPADSVHQLQSATKSITSTLLGIALHQGLIESVEQPVLSFFSDKKIEYPDSLLDAMTIKDLLTQRTGMAWKEAPWDSPDNTWRMILETEGDWYEMILNTPMREEPGTRFNYGNAAPVLITGIIQEVSGMDIDAFAKKYLFDPLDIEQFRYWGGNGGPANNGGALLFLTSKDLAKIGQLYLQDGVWEGKRILPEGWVQEATSTYVNGNIDNRFYKFGYGYFWWSVGPPLSEDYPNIPNSIFMARGAGGQHLIVHPEEKMAVVITAWNLQQSSLPLTIYTNYILPEKYKQKLEPELFAPDVLTDEVETSVTLSPDEQELFFARKDTFFSMSRKSTIYHSKRLKYGSWSKPQVAPFSGTYSESNPFITPDGKKLFFTSRRPVNSGEAAKDNSDIWYIEKTADGWGKPRHLGLTVNSEASEYSPTTDREGNLYFGSYREGGKGSGDIWMSKWKNGAYQAPVNLSQAINTPHGEWGSCIEPDGNFIIWEASGRDEGISPSGDLYISYKKDGVWQEAQHLTLLSSGGSDLTPKIHGDYLYFASNRHKDFMIQINNNNVELYRIALKEILRR